MAMSLCAWAKKSVKLFWGAAVIGFSKKYTGKASRCRNNHKADSSVRSQASRDSWNLSDEFRLARGNRGAIAFSEN